MQPPPPYFFSFSPPLSPSRSRPPSPARRPPFPLQHREPNPPLSDIEIGSLSFSISLSLAPSDDINDDGHAGISLQSSLSYTLPRSYRPMRSLLRLRCAVAVPRLTPPSLSVAHHQRIAPPALLPAAPGTARCYPRAIRACAIYPFVRRAIPSPHPLPASRSPASTSACASAAIKVRSVATARACPAPHWSSGTSERS